MFECDCAHAPTLVKLLSQPGPDDEPVAREALRVAYDVIKAAFKQCVGPREMLLNSRRTADRECC